MKGMISEALSAIENQLAQVPEEPRLLRMRSLLKAAARAVAQQDEVMAWKLISRALNAGTDMGSNSARRQREFQLT